jgi:hypothetical protein
MRGRKRLLGCTPPRLRFALVVLQVAMGMTTQVFGQQPDADAAMPQEEAPPANNEPAGEQPAGQEPPTEPPAPPAETVEPNLTVQLEPDAPKAEAGTSEGTELLVTGSRIKVKSAFAASAPVEVVDRKKLEQAGVTNLSDVVQNLTSAQGSGFQGEGQGSRQGRVGLTGVDLRGLGFGATLVLVNGRRLPISGGTAPGLGGGATADMGLIPMAAVERIEILKGGASAIYGSDAVAGVVNIITRKNWDGLRVGIEGEAADRLDYKSYNINGVFGATGEHSRLLTAVSWDLHNELKTNERDWTSRGQLEIPQGYPGVLARVSSPHRAAEPASCARSAIATSKCSYRPCSAARCSPVPSTT